MSTRLGRYTLDQRLGGGGMGHVYRAHVTGAGGFHRDVAIKVMREEYAADPKLKALFLREGRVLAALRHRGVVQILDLDVEGGRAYLAMELLDGVDLRHLCRANEGRLPWRAVAYVGVEVARALQAAHALKNEEAPRGIIHGDLSPSNVMACTDGAVKILDFGLARPAGVEPSTTSVRGKLPYLPPECFMGVRVDERVDVYALGVILFELVTGRLLFRADSDAAVMRSVLHDPVPSAQELCPEIPAALSEVIGRALARDLDLRIPSAAQLAQTLELVLDGKFGAKDMEAMVAAAGPMKPAAQVPLEGELGTAHPFLRRATLFAGGALVAGLTGAATWLWLDANRAAAPVLDKRVEARAEPTPTVLPVAEPKPAPPPVAPAEAPAEAATEAPTEAQPPVAQPEPESTASPTKRRAPKQRPTTKKPADPSKAIAPGLVVDPYGGSTP